MLGNLEEKSIASRIVQFWGCKDLLKKFSERENSEEDSAWAQVKLLLHTFLLEEKYAPLAQLVEQLTLNQWVHGSSPWWCTRFGALWVRNKIHSGTEKYRKSNCYGPLVKRLRRRPLTPQTGVRFSHGSPNFFKKDVDSRLMVCYNNKAAQECATK